MQVKDEDGKEAENKPDEEGWEIEGGSAADEIVEQVENMAESDGVYLSGPIRCADDDGRGWREDLIEDYGEEFTFNNPLDMYDPDEVDIVCDPVDYLPDSDREQILPSEYVTQDKYLIADSECVFVGLPEIIARGTMLECGFAKWAIGIPFFVWKNEGQEESGWIFDNAKYVSENREDVIRAIRNWMNRKQ